MYLFAFIGLFAASCNDPDDGSQTSPITLYEKMNGDWSLMNLKMVDEVAKANNVQPNEENLSNWFNFENFSINFKTSGNQPTTYAVSGNVPPLFEPAGYWQLDTPFQRTDGKAATILLFSDAAKTQKTDELRLTSVPGSNGEMEIQLNRKSGGNAFISYVFKLTKNP